MRERGEKGKEMERESEEHIRRKERAKKRTERALREKVKCGDKKSTMASRKTIKKETITRLSKKEIENASETKDQHPHKNSHTHIHTYTHIHTFTHSHLKERNRELVQIKRKTHIHTQTRTRARTRTHLKQAEGHHVQLQCCQVLQRLHNGPNEVGVGLKNAKARKVREG